MHPSCDAILFGFRGVGHADMHAVLTVELVQLRNYGYGYLVPQWILQAARGRG